MALIPIQVKIDALHIGSTNIGVEILNLWDFCYDKETRTLFLKSYRKYFKEPGRNRRIDTEILPEFEDDPDEKLELALGPDHDRQKVLHIAKAKALESDLYMRANEVDCISVEWWKQNQ
jgi:hypothetical protein